MKRESDGKGVAKKGAKETMAKTRVIVMRVAKEEKRAKKSGEESY
jgi:hypothetical protein